MKLYVKKVGEYRGFCREYFEDSRGRTFAKQEDWPGVYNWYTCTKDGEPDCPLKPEVEVIEEGRANDEFKERTARYGIHGKKKDY